MDLDKIKDDGLIKLYSDIIKELKKRNIVRSKNIIGDLGEYLAIYHYNKTPGLPNLQAAPAGTQNVDALSRKGERYSIKSTSGNLTGVFYGLNDIDSKEPELQKFEYVIIVIFKGDFELDKIIEINWDQLLKHKKWHKTMRGWNLTISKSLIAESKIIFSK
ncbi:MAG: hypothetical protein BWX72_00144 [Firmicutes bacterium ADurb.Bin080]|nr:MAG: hypothetical protein BWX72_00144 [Firmicutes bacterium ADurb.Bin080]